MKTKRVITLFVCLLCAVEGIVAQEAGGHVTLLKKNEAAKAGIGHVTLLKRSAAMIYLGGGGSFPLGTGNSTANLKSTAGANADIYVPILKKQLLTLGINVSSDFTFSNKQLFGKEPAPYHIVGEVSTTVTSSSAGSPKQQNFKFGAGPQLNIHITDKFIISPIFDIGFMSITQRSYSAVQNSTVTYNGSTDPYTYTLLSQSETSTNGLALIPKVRLHYFFNNWIGIWAEATYTYGPSVKSVVSTFAPDGVADVNGQYTLAQMIEGHTTIETHESHYSAVGVNGGLVFAIGGGKKPPTDVERGTQPNGQDDGNPYPPKKGTPKAKPTSTQDEPKIKDEPRPVAKIQKEESCNPTITYPASGQHYNTGSKITISVNVPDSYKGDNTIRVYKVSNDPLYYSKLDSNDQRRLTGGDQKNKSGAWSEGDIKTSPLKEQMTGSTQNKTATILPQGEGTYMVYAGEGTCSSPPVMISSSSCWPTAKDSINAVCRADGKITVSGVIHIDYTTSTNPANNIHNIIVNFVRIDNVKDANGNAVSTTVPAAGQVLTATNAGVDYSYQFVVNDNMCNKKLVINYTVDVTCTTTGVSGSQHIVLPCNIVKSMPCCICDVCEKSMEWDEDEPIITPTAGSVNISHNIWQNHSGNYVVTHAKAEIIGYQRFVDNVCMTCNTDASLWGNFTEGALGDLQAKFGAATNGILGNAHHSLYWYMPGDHSMLSNTFITKISTPPLSGLSCCCDSSVVTIRYTFTYRDEATGECKTCSKWKDYSFKAGVCDTTPSPPPTGHQNPKN